jgi:hypothetical protein
MSNSPPYHESHDQVIYAHNRYAYTGIHRTFVRHTLRIVSRSAKSIGRRPLDKNGRGHHHRVRPLSLEWRGGGCQIRPRPTENLANQTFSFLPFLRPSLFISLIKRDEILNGKTLDRNSHYFARYCFENGIELYVDCVCVPFLLFFCFGVL